MRLSLIRFAAVAAAVLLCAGKNRAAEDYTLSDLSLTPPLPAMSGGGFTLEASVTGGGPIIAEGGGFRMEATVTPLPPVVVLGDAEVFITINGAEAVLTWTAAGAGYVLESTSALGDLSSWHPVEPPPAELRFVVPLQGSAQFFRLRRP